MSAIINSDKAGLLADSHAGCLFCGKNNPISLLLDFQADPEKGVRASFHPRERFQGYSGILHGGSIAGVLDEAMTHCLFHAGVKAMTGDLHVRFIKPVPVREDLKVHAWIVTARSPLYRLRAELTQSGRILAWAEAKFMQSDQQGARIRLEGKP